MFQPLRCAYDFFSSALGAWSISMGDGRGQAVCPLVFEDWYYAIDFSVENCFSFNFKLLKLIHLEKILLAPKKLLVPQKKILYTPMFTPTIFPEKARKRVAVLHPISRIQTIQTCSPATNVTTLFRKSFLKLILRQRYQVLYVRYAIHWGDGSVWLATLPNKSSNTPFARGFLRLIS